MYKDEIDDVLELLEKEDSCLTERVISLIQNLRDENESLRDRLSW